MDGLPIMKMASVIRLMQQNACFHLVIARRSFAWDSLTVEMRWWWTCLQESDTLFFHFL
uniref:Uncharacterized protein n=1 Tax=Arundo donax TaxID=35708 RepID=A0A0A9E1L6_ARUDO